MEAKFGPAFNAPAIRAATVAARDANSDSGASAEQQIADLIETGFGCHKAQVRSLVKLLGHDLPDPRPTANGTPGVGTLAFYDREPRVIVTIDGDGDAVGVGATGNSTFISKRSTWRYATDDELFSAFA